MSTTDSPKTVISLTSDLMMAGKISSLARSNGLTCKIVNSIRQLRTSEPEKDSGSVLWCVDLQTVADDLGEIVNAAKLVNARLVAYSQHVYPEILEQARSQGVESVMTRGQFDKNIAGLIESAAAETGIS